VSRKFTAWFASDVTAGPIGMLMVARVGTQRSSLTSSSLPKVPIR
jgi:hypothetical protein